MILEQLYEIQRNIGDRESEIQAYKWWTSAKKDTKNPDVVFVEDQLMQNGKIHTFNYNPKHKDKLDYYDKKPVVLSIGTIVNGRSRLELGINLNFIPKPWKWQLLDTVQKTYSGFFQRVNSAKVPAFANKQPMIRYNYNALRAILNTYNVGFALRTYIPSRKSKLYVINYNSWVNAGLLSIEDFEGITYNQMISQYKRSRN